VIRSALLKSSPERTFESLYRRQVKDVYRYALAILHRQADAEDATQTTFMNAYRALERGERPRDAGKWLRSIALNVCREHHRRAGRRPNEVSLDDDPGELVLDPPTPAIGDVVRGLRCLPFNQRAALVMREFEGRSLAEVGTELKLSTSAVEALLFRARRALREQLEEQLTCSEAEQAISRQLDGALPRGERGPLRAHLRSCQDCASLARKLRAQRSAIKSLAFIPLPLSLKLGKTMGGGAVSASAAATAGSSAVPAGGSLIGGLLSSVAAKVAIATIAGGAAFGVGYASLHHGRAQAIPPHGQGVAAARVREHSRSSQAAHSPRGAGSAIIASQTPVPSSLKRRVAARGDDAARRDGSSSANARRTASPAPRRSNGGAGHPTAGITPAPASPQTVTTGPSRPASGSKGHGEHSASGHGHSSTAPGQTAHGTAGGIGHAYGHAKTEKPAPPGHAYGHTKHATTSQPPATTSTPTTTTPAPPAKLPPGQAKKQAGTELQGKGAQK
jgi:RNA polymerase sigma factor (sigma-70 family)